MDAQPAKTLWALVYYAAYSPDGKRVRCTRWFPDLDICTRRAEEITRRGGEVIYMQRYDAIAGAAEAG